MNKSFAVLMLLTAAGLVHHAVAQENDINTRLDQHDTRLNTLEHTLNSIEDKQQIQNGKIEWIDGSTNRAHDRINGLDNKTDATNNAVVQLTAKQDAHTAALSDHDARIQNNTKGITETNKRIDNLQNEVNIKASAASVDALTHSVSDISSQVTATEGNVTQLAQHSAQLDSKTAALDSKTTALDSKTTALSAHAAAAETRAKSTEARTTRLENRSDAHEARTTALEERAETLQSNANQLEKTQVATGRQVETNRQDILRINSTVTNAMTVNSDAYHFMASGNQRLDELNNDIRRVDQASIARAHRALEQSKQYTDQKAAELRSDIRSVRDEERAGIASVTALSAIPEISGKTFDIGVGVGSFKNSAAVAIGVHYRPSDSNVFKLGVATSENNDPVIGAGFSCGW